jgi:hypothetical protein
VHRPCSGEDDCSIVEGGEQLWCHLEHCTQTDCTSSEDCPQGTVCVLGQDPELDTTYCALPCGNRSDCDVGAWTWPPDCGYQSEFGGEELRVCQLGTGSTRSSSSVSLGASSSSSGCESEGFESEGCESDGCDGPTGCLLVPHTFVLIPLLGLLRRRASPEDPQSDRRGGVA